MSSLIYIRGSVLFAGSADWSSSDQKFHMLLATDEYTPDRKHKFVSQVRGELYGGGYERKELTGRTVKPSDTGADCFADTVSFSGLRSHQTYKWIVIFKGSKTDADSGLICAIDMTGVSLLGVHDHVIKWDGQTKNGRAFSLLS